MNKTPNPKYAVRSMTTCSMNKKRCWMNIGIEKLQKAASENRSYLFQFIIGNEQYLFSAPASELKTRFDEYGVPVMMRDEYAKYSFYVDYRSGEIFDTVSENNQDVVFKLYEEGKDSSEVIGEDIGAAPSSLFHTLGLERVKYKELSSKGKEAYNTHKLCSLLADYGYECHRISNDVDGADIVAYRNTRDKNKANSAVDVLLIQIKGRLTIKEAYKNKKLYIAFPASEGWYLVPHDEMVETIVPKHWLDTKSWKEGFYHAGKLSTELKERLEPYLLPWSEGKLGR